jgi:hypothetical protein
MALRKDFPQAFFAVLAISWFWFLGATYLSQIPVLVADQLGGNDKVVLLFLTVFSVGIALGAWLAGRYQKPVRSLTNVRWLVWLLMAISVTILIGNLAMNRVVLTDDLVGVADFFGQTSAVVVLLTMLLIAIFGGLFTVPLYTLLQVQTPHHFRSRMVAVNNITNALLMVLSSLFIMVLYAFEFGLMQILYGVALLNLLAALWYLKRGRWLTQSL